MIDFLNNRLPFSLFEEAYVFGSVVRETPNPNDCDLLIVLGCNPNEIKWEVAIKSVEDVKSEFVLKFNIPLNTLIYTVEEMRELTALQKRIFSKKLIRLK